MTLIRKQMSFKVEKDTILVHEAISLNKNEPINKVMKNISIFIKSHFILEKNQTMP